MSIAEKTRPIAVSSLRDHSSSDIEVFTTEHGQHEHAQHEHDARDQHEHNAHDQHEHNAHDQREHNAHDQREHTAHDHRTQRTIVSLDTLGIAASTLCLVHCLAMPFLITMLPFLGLQFLEGNLAHRILAVFVISFALFAVLPGYLKHRENVVLYAMLAGLSLVLFATFALKFTFGESWELPLISAGNLILVATHLRNRHLLKCNHAH